MIASPHPGLIVNSSQQMLSVLSMSSLKANEKGPNNLPPRLSEVAA